MTLKRRLRPGDLVTVARSGASFYRSLEYRNMFGLGKSETLDVGRVCVVLYVADPIQNEPSLVRVLTEGKTGYVSENLLNLSE